MSTNNTSGIRDKVAQNDVTMGRSYLEVDVMEWFSENEIPFAYEPFVIPSVVGPSNNMWDKMTSAIRALGNGNEQAYEDRTDGTPFEDVSAFEALNMWNEIYDKHDLAGEQVVIPVRESLSRFRKKLILPDFTIYKDVDFKTAPENFDYSDYDYIVEVSGLWGVGLPGESTEEDWWEWYRVSAVAFKEFIYKMLGLWDQVYWVVPNQAYIEGVTDGLPKELRDDPHYVILNTTQSNIQMDRLEDALGVTADTMDGGLSPIIELANYDRPGTQELPSSFSLTRWEFDGINLENVDAHEKATIVEDDYVVFHGELGEVYISRNGVQVSEIQWRQTNMILLREYIVDVMSKLDDVGVVDGLRKVE